jgi:hypothetical protein
MSVYNVIKKFKKIGEYINMRETFGCGRGMQIPFGSDKGAYGVNDFDSEELLVTKLKKFLK